MMNTQTDKNLQRKVVGVIGSGDEIAELNILAESVGRLIAQHGWVLVTGGLGGVMASASRGANSAGGLVIGILPGDSPCGANRWVEVPIATNMGHARNVVIAQSASALIAVGGGLGTLSEMSIGLKLGKPVVGLNSWPEARIPGLIRAENPESAVMSIAQKLGITRN